MLKVGVIIVCYNSATTIRRTLLSIQCQTLQPDELIIIDGNSRDDTLGIIKEFSHLVTTLISEKDGGIYNAMNKGLEIATSDVIGFLNSDDEFSSSSSLETVKQGLLSKPKAKIFVSGVDYLSNDGSMARRWRIRKVESFESGWHPPHPGFYASTRLLKKLGGFNEDYQIAADFDLMLRVFSNVNVEEVVVDNGKIVNMYLGGASNASLKNILKGNAEIRRSFASNGKKVTIMYTVKRLMKKLLVKWL